MPPSPGFGGLVVPAFGPFISCFYLVAGSPGDYGRRTKVFVSVCRVYFKKGTHTARLG